MRKGPATAGVNTTVQYAEVPVVRTGGRLHEADAGEKLPVLLEVKVIVP
jgi:hypothetical protein